MCLSNKLLSVTFSKQTLQMCKQVEKLFNFPSIIQQLTVQFVTLEPYSRCRGNKMMPAVLKIHLCAFKAMTDTHSSLPRLLVTGGRFEQQRLPEDLCVQPALALLIHFEFAKQTFQITSIHQTSLKLSSQHVSCHNAEDFSHR